MWFEIIEIEELEFKTKVGLKFTQFLNIRFRQSERKMNIRNVQIITSRFGRLLLRLFFPLKAVIYPDKRPFSREKLSTK